MKMWEKRAALACLSIAVLGGCVSKSQHDAVLAQLEECKTDKQTAQDAFAGCEEKFDREVSQWDNMETLVSEALPNALQDFRQERDEVLELVPEAARQEVEKYLDDFSEAIRQGFGRMAESNQRLEAANERILTQLEDARSQLEEVGVTTREIDETVGQSLKSAYANRDQMRRDAREIIQAVRDFDSAYINDRESDDRLHLNRKERETIVAFHRDLVSQLNALGAAAEGTGEAAKSGSDPAEGEPEVEGPDEG